MVEKKSEISFKFTPENLEKAEMFINKYPKDHSRASVMPLLTLAQRQNNNYLSNEAIEYVANFLNIPPIKVFEVASFYTMYNLKPVGKYHVQVCGTTPCMLCGAENILKICETELNIKKGQTTQDGNFTLSEVECLGACVNAPVVQINDDYYEDLSEESLKTILECLKEGKQVKVGSQIGRQFSKAKHAETTR